MRFRSAVQQRLFKPWHWHRVADVGAGAMQVHWWRVCGAGKRRGGVVGVRHAIGIWVCMSVGE